MFTTTKILTGCLAASAIACFVGAATIDESPELSVISIPSTVDLGLTPKETVRSCEIVLKNQGRSTVQIVNTASSCGCTDVTTSNKTILPGKTSILHVNVKTGSEVGEWVRTVAVDFVKDQGDKHAVVSVPIRLHIEP